LPVAVSASTALVGNSDTGEIIRRAQTSFDRETGAQHPLSPYKLAPAQNPAFVYIAGLSAGSRRTMKQALNAIADLLGIPEYILGQRYDVRYAHTPWHLLRYQHTQALRAGLAQRYHARTANKMLSALRRVLKEAWRLGLMTAEESARAADVKNIEVSRPSQAETGRHLRLGELRALLDACAAPAPRGLPEAGALWARLPSKAGARDAAVIAIGFACGLRRAELAGLQLQDVDLDKEALTIHGKRNKTRIVYVQSGALDALTDWLDVRGGRAPGEDGCGPLFLRIRRGDHITNAGITSQAIYNILEKRRKQAGVEPFTPHDLRRTFAGELLDAGADIATVQQLMGHANVQTREPPGARL
jgi:integrase